MTHPEIEIVMSQLDPTSGQIWGYSMLFCNKFEMVWKNDTQSSTGFQIYMRSVLAH